MNETTDITKRTETMAEKRQQLSTIAPTVDIFENEDEILLHADMPGVTKEKIAINIDNGKLVITGVRNLDVKGIQTWQEFGDVEYRRAFSVPQSINVAKVRAELKDGVLKLHLPKSAAAKPQTIKIHSA